ncbi:MAG: hypothetical protein HQL53_14115 [Magnetococcales bacterium]|nr:hypothetical protein [Magnetococcales bacterium]
MSFGHFINGITARFREPSSWGGIAVLLTVFGMSDVEAKAITDLLAAIAATTAVFMHEKGSW